MEKKDAFQKLCLVLFTITTAESINIISRAEWGARATKNPYDALKINPPPYVVIHHADSPSCYNMDTCENLVKSFQNFHMDHRGWDDIGYNFLVGEDGQIYEGRGWGAKGAHAPLVNARSIGICIIGSFTDNLPNAKALKTVKDLIDWGVANKKISPNYNLIGHRQATDTKCPGKTLYDEIKTWNNWSPVVT